MFLPEAVGYQTNSLVPGIRHLSFKLLVYVVPNQYRLLQLFLVTHENLTIRPIDEDITDFGDSIWRNQTGTDLKESFLLVILHSTRR